MSGYTDQHREQGIVPSASGSFLAKPFTPLVVTQTVREVLDKP